jgi:hypothetical protein
MQLNRRHLEVAEDVLHQNHRRDDDERDVGIGELIESYYQAFFESVSDATDTDYTGDLVRADEDVAVGAEIAPAGRPLRAQDLGMLAAAGVTEVAVRARPRVAIVSTGDEVVPPETARLDPGQVRDATASALAAMVTYGPDVRGVDGAEDFVLV